MLALDERTHKARLILEGLHTAKVERQQTTRASELTKWRRLCFSLEWQPDVDMLTKEELQEYCNTVEAPGTPADDINEDIEFVFCHLVEYLGQLVAKPYRDYRAPPQAVH